MAAIRAGQGLLVGLLRCGHCGRKLHVRYWGGRGTKARYLCKGDYDDGGQYCIGSGGSSVDRRVGQELLKAIAPLGVEASLRALEELSAGGTAQRASGSERIGATYQRLELARRLPIGRAILVQDAQLPFGVFTILLGDAFKVGANRRG